MSSAALRVPREPAQHLLLSALSDQRLAKLAAGGSQQAFAKIYERHHAELYRYCRSITANEQDARDALQDTMIKAMRALPGEQREIALKPWLFRIAHNECVSMMRKRRDSAPIDSVPELQAAADDPATREQVRELFQDLAHLTPRQRGALVMRELNGLSFDEIAAATSTTAASAKQTVYEARQALLEVAKGRETDCREVRERISAHDRRLLRGRGVSAHLRNCAGCREFEDQIASRSSSMAAVAPLPAATATGILQSVLGTAAVGGGAAGGGGIAIGTIAGGSLTAAAKLGIAGIIALGVGAVAIETHNSGADHPAGADGANGPVVVPSKAAHVAGAAATGATPATHKGGAGHHGGAGSQAGGTGASPGHGTAGAGTHGSGGAQGAPTSEGGSSEGGQGSQGGAPGATGGAYTAPPSSSGDGTSPGSSGAAPGHGATPPGQGGTPPGLDGEAPPGLGGTPPGLDGGAPPAQTESAPGASDIVPGLSENLPPGVGGLVPGEGIGHN